MESLPFNINIKQANLFTSALESDEGRVQLAQAMVTPISNYMHNSLARKYLGPPLIVESGCIPAVESTHPMVVAKQKGAGINDHLTDSYKVIPTFELAAHPSIQLKVFKEERFKALEWVLNKSALSLRRAEDSKFIDLLGYSCSEIDNTKFFSDFVDSPKDFWAEFADVYMEVRKNRFEFDTVLVPARIQSDPGWIKSTEAFKDLNFQYHTADDSFQVIFLNTSQQMGQFVIRQDLTVLPADDPMRLRVGWVVYQEIGMAMNLGCAMNVVVPSEDHFYRRDIGWRLYDEYKNSV